MKKIFLIPLLTLMCSITAWADVTIKRVDVPTKADLVTALANAAGQDSTEITLTGDITITDGVFNVPSGAHVLLNLNGHGMTSTFVQPDEGADISQDALIYNQGTLHIISKGSSIVQKTTSTTYQPAVICNKGNLIIDGGIFISGSVWSPWGIAWKNPVIWGKDASSNIIINGGTFLLDESYSDHARGPILPVIATGGGTLTVTGGIFSTSEENYNGHHHAAADLMGHYDADKYTTIEVPYTNENIPGYTSDRQNHIRTNNNNGNRDYRTAPKKVCMVIPTNADPDNFLYVSENTTITVPDGETLRVGAGGIVMGSTTTSKIIVEAGGTLISDKDIITSSYDNIELTMDAKNKKYSQLLIKPYVQQEQHPEATVVLKSKAYKMTATENAWQRFAVPTYKNSLTRAAGIAYDATAFPTAIYRWDYTSANDNKWTIMTKAENRAFEPFECYNLSTNVMDAANRAAYTFQCELVGNGNANLNFVGADWNYFANSYTAPIDLRAFVTDLFENYSSTLFSTVYIHNIDGDGWDPVSWGAVEDDDLVQTKIQPMQAFVLYKMGAIDSYTIDYKNLIYNPVMAALSSSPAPARRTQTGIDYQRASVVITDENGKSDVVKFYEGAEFDSNINNGYDVLKLMNEGKLSAYIVAQEGKMAYLASDNIENATIAMQTKEATTYTLSFKNVTLEGYGVRDNLTGTTTEIKEGNTYHFSAPANAAVEGRFQVVAMPKITTAVENVENATATKGIYTLTGIYMGEDFNAVPAGIYIVNGKKMVK
jgi:hypothetical protein